jgi:hypothetical protein
MRERVGREDRVVDDDRLNLAPKETDFKFAPKFVGITAGVVLLEPSKPAARCVAMPEPVMSHRQECLILR